MPFGWSIEFADWLGVRFMFAGAGLGVLALVVSLVSAYLLYKVADVAQKELASATRASAERVAELSAEAEAAKAGRKATELELEKLKKKTGPRIIDIAKFREAIQGVSAPKVLRIWTSDEASDGPLVESQLAIIFSGLNWPVTSRSPIPPNDDFLRMIKRGMRMFSENDSRVAVIGRSNSPQVPALVKAFTATLGGTYSPHPEDDADFPADEVWLLILAKY
jgi:hypothetical protein